MEEAVIDKVVRLRLAYHRAPPVTPWRASLAGLTDALVKTIFENEDPERQFLLARETSEDIVHAIKTRLRERYGRVFDPIWDGPAS